MLLHNVITLVVTVWLVGLALVWLFIYGASR